MLLMIIMLFHLNIKQVLLVIQETMKKNGIKVAVKLSVEFSLKWIDNCVLTTAAIGANDGATGADSTTFKITDAKLYVPIVTLLAEDNAKLSKSLSDGFKRAVYWNKYKVMTIK